MRKKIWIFAAIAMTALSCSKQENGGEITPPDNGQEIEKIYLKINSASVEQTGEEPTKAAIKETKFPTELPASIGIFVVGDGYTDAKYCNVQCTKPAGSDKFNAPLIELKADKATIYAYFPYDENIKTFDELKAISVATSVGGDDWMWATPVTEVSTEKPAIDLTFNHALALVEITFNVVGPEGTMTNVTLAGGTGAFSKAGTMDATDGGALTPDTGQMATKTSPFSQDINLQMSEGKIVADCLLVPGKTGTDADARQDFYIKCTYNGKTLSASLTGDNGVIVRKNTKSTVSLNIKDNKLEVVSVGVVPWTDSNVSGNIAKVDGYTVTFNCPEGLKYELRTESESTAIPGETTDAEKPVAIFRYDMNSIPDYRFVFNGSVSGCAVSHDWQNGVITVKDLTDNVTINLGFGTYIPYTSTAKVEPKDKTALGSPYDEARSTFSGGSGVVAIDGGIETIGRVAFDGCTSLTGVDLSGCKNLKTIKEYAFNACTHLTSVKLPEGLETIELNVFWHMGEDVTNEEDWKPLELPSTLSTIGQYAFEDSRFTSVTLPAALNTVGTDIFKYSSVKTLTIEDGAVIGRKMFNSCFKLTTVICKSTTPPNMMADDGLYAIANEDGNKALTNIQNIYVPSSSVKAYQSAPGWSMYSDKISAIPSQD